MGGLFKGQALRAVQALPGMDAGAAAIASREDGQLFPGPAADRPLLKIGLCSSLSCGYLRELIRSVAEAVHPPELSFREASPERIVQAARQREVDVAFIYGSRPPEHLERQALWSEPVLAALPEQHPLARDSEVTTAQLLRQRFLTHGGAGEHDHQAALIREILGAAPSQVDCLPVERETLLELTALGFGVTLIAGSAAANFHPGVAYRPISGGPAEVQFQAVWKAGGANPALGPFLAQARAVTSRADPFGRPRQGP